MTQAQLFAAVRALPMMIRKDDAGEYRVTYPESDMPADRREACASYTDDKAEALATAQAMRAHFDGLTPDQRRAVISGSYL